LRNHSAESTLEIEIKLRVADRDALRERLARLKAQPTRARVHEMNTLYDTRDGALARRGQMIRVRVEREVGLPGKLSKGPSKDADKTVTLTYKGPVKDHEEGDGKKVRGNGRAARQPDGEKAAWNFAEQYKGATRYKVGAAGPYKVREEREVRASDERAIAEILGALGLAPRFRYEKYRSTYRLPGIAHVVVELDETPMGDFLELEGRREAIDRAAARLGFGRADYIIESYGALYAEDCAEGGRAVFQNEPGGPVRAAEMLFRNRERGRRKTNRPETRTRVRRDPVV
jgi:adenylate cyclase class IV